MKGMEGGGTGRKRTDTKLVFPKFNKKKAKVITSKAIVYQDLCKYRQFFKIANFPKCIYSPYLLDYVQSDLNSK